MGISSSSIADGLTLTRQCLPDGYLSVYRPVCIGGKAAYSLRCVDGDAEKQCAVPRR